MKVGRLAMRHEGTFWNAYYAMPDTMDGAVLLGSIAMRFVADATRRDRFMALMKEAVRHHRRANRPSPDMAGRPAPRPGTRRCTSTRRRGS